MRRGLLIFLLVTLAILGFLLNQVWMLLGLLVVEVTGDAILRSELPATTAIPPVWQEVQASDIALRPEGEGWEYKLWTDEMGLQFIQQEYERFYETYARQRYPTQRADAIRYFVLAHYGGIYIDLDDGCNRSLEPLLVYPSFVSRTISTGISNDVMGAVPGHLFFVRVSERIKNYDRGWWCSRMALYIGDRPHQA
ncbi:CSG1/SUR1-like protein [Elasticomyces elasticus]|nr:CSG1/SUR1-like protein [Elasticomyces elasticus]KAK5735790.1 CSG1/SUR1-like protein [Elasticomyces elasticus]